VEWEGVKVGHYRVSPGRLAGHYHKTNKVFVPLRGSVMIDGGPEMLPGAGRRNVGDVSVSPPGLHYGAHWDEELDHLSVSIEDSFLERATVDFEANRNAKIILSCGPQDPLLHSIAVSLANELDSEMPAGRLYAESLVNTLTIHLLRHYSTDSLIPDLQFGGLQPQKLRRVLEFIDANLESDLSLAELAEEADLSLYHFARAFKQSMGSTPIQFLMQQRIDRAKTMLAASELPLSQIALTVGFKNQSHFTTQFRKFTEMTPRAWRNQYAR
jgi:AraC family transcriptional regulator